MAEFRKLCRQRGGITLSNVVITHGVRYEEGGAIFDAFWLLFDAGAPAVELLEPASTIESGGVIGGATIDPWFAHVGAPTWRVERRPEDDPECAPFDAWLAQYQSRGYGPQGMHERWLDRASYRHQCAVVTFPEPESEQDRMLRTASAWDWPVAAPVLRTEQAGSGKIGGCHRAFETRYSLIGGGRYLEITSFHLFNQCTTGDGLYVDATCGDPNVVDLFKGREVFYDPNLATELRPEIKHESNRCRDNGGCWQERARVLRAPR